jgi:AcrR family transcriptional regulator
MAIRHRNRYSTFAMGARSAKKEVRAARAQLYHRLICGAAERVFATYGFAGARVEEIARISGVSIGTIYRVFPGRKRAIYHATIEGRSSELVETTRAAGLAAAQRGGNLVDAWLASIGLLVEYFLEHPDFLQIALREQQTSWAIGPVRKAREQLAMWRESVDATVLGMQQGIEQGFLVDDDPQRMARAWLALQQAHLGYWLEQREGSAKEVAEGLQRQFVRAFCRPEVQAERNREPTAVPRVTDADKATGPPPRRGPNTPRA